MTSGAVQRVTILDVLRAAFIIRIGGSKAHLALQRTTFLRESRTLCGRALHETPEHAIYVSPDTWMTTEDVCVRCVQRAQAQRLIILTPYTEADRRREDRLAARALGQALTQRTGGNTQP